MSVPAVASIPKRASDTVPNARTVLNAVFGLPGFRGAQEDIVGHVVADGNCLACPFVARDFITSHSEQYRKRFGVVPGFRAALHCGEIVAGEIGDVRREIAYVGDTLNVAARLLEAAKTVGRDVLVSAELLERATLPAGIEAEPLPTLTVRGRAAPLAIAALQRVGAGS